MLPYNINIRTVRSPSWCTDFFSIFSRPLFRVVSLRRVECTWRIRVRCVSGTERTRAQSANESRTSDHQRRAVGGPVGRPRSGTNDCCAVLPAGRGASRLLPQSAAQAASIVGGGGGARLRRLRMTPTRKTGCREFSRPIELVCPCGGLQRHRARRVRQLCTRTDSRTRDTIKRSVSTK